MLVWVYSIEYYLVLRTSAPEKKNCRKRDRTLVVPEAERAMPYPGEDVYSGYIIMACANKNWLETD